MFDTFTMRSMPVRSAASITLVSSVDLLPRRRRHEEHRPYAFARGHHRRHVAEVAEYHLGGIDLADGLGPAHERAHRRARARGARARRAHPGRPRHRSRAPSRRESREVACRSWVRRSCGDRDVDRRPRELEPRSAAARAGASRSRGCPSPSRASARYTVISVDDHVVEPPDAFTGPLPAASSPTRSRASSPPTTAARRGCGRASCSRTSASTRSSAGRRREYGFEPTRFDEMRRGAWDVHARVADMDIDGVYASLCFPSFLPGLRRAAAHAVARRRRARARRDARVQRLAPRGVVRRRIPTASSRTRSRTCAIPRSRPRRSAATRRAASRRSRSRKRPTSSACRRSTPATGIRCSRRARRPRPCCACTSGRRARRRPRRPTRRPRSPRCCSARTACTARSTGSTRRCRCASPTSRSACRKAASAGSPGIIDRLDHCYRYQLGYLPTWRDVDRVAERGAAPQLLVLRARRRRGHARARPHRRRPHPRRVRLPARRLVVAGHAGDARAPARRPGRRPTTTPRRITWQNASELFRHPVPDVAAAVTRGRTTLACVARATRASDPTACVRRGRERRHDDVGASTTSVSDRMAGALLRGVRDPGDRVALQLRRRPARARGDARVREGRRRRRRHRRACRRARGRRTSSSARGARTLLTDPPRCSRRAAGRRARPIGARRRALVPQLHLGHDRAAEDRDAQPGALVRVPRASRTRVANFTRRRRVPQRAARRRSASGLWTRTSRPRSSGAPCVVVRALLARGRARRDRALPRDRARRGLDASS